MRPDLTVVVTTRDRPALVTRAVESALAQTEPVSVLVVDDGSVDALDLPRHPRLRVVRHPASRGVSAARNTGASQATTRFVTFLDDDDQHRPQLAAASLEAWSASALPPPVGVLSALAVLADDRVRAVRIPPPSRPRGECFQLEPAPAGTSYHTKQTLVVERDVLLGIGGFDPAFRSRVTTELFLRLNPVCSLAGIPSVTYDLTEHTGPRISADRSLRVTSFEQLERKHRDLFASHPTGYAELLWQHARTCVQDRLPWHAVRVLARAARIAPAPTARRLVGVALRR